MGNLHVQPGSRHGTQGAQLVLCICIASDLIVMDTMHALLITILVCHWAEERTRRLAIEPAELLLERKFGRELHPITDVRFEAVHEVVPLTSTSAL